MSGASCKYDTEQRSISSSIKTIIIYRCVKAEIHTSSIFSSSPCISFPTLVDETSEAEMPVLADEAPVEVEKRRTAMDSESTKLPLEKPETATNVTDGSNTCQGCCPPSELLEDPFNFQCEQNADCPIGNICCGTKGKLR